MSSRALLHPLWLGLFVYAVRGNSYWSCCKISSSGQRVKTNVQYSFRCVDGGDIMETKFTDRVCFAITEVLETQVCRSVPEMSSENCTIWLPWHSVGECTSNGIQQLSRIRFSLPSENTIQPVNFTRERFEISCNYEKSDESKENIGMYVGVGLFLLTLILVFCGAVVIVIRRQKLRRRRQAEALRTVPTSQFIVNFNYCMRANLSRPTQNRANQRTDQNSQRNGPMITSVTDHPILPPPYEETSIPVSEISANILLFSSRNLDRPPPIYDQVFGNAAVVEDSMDSRPPSYRNINFDPHENNPVSP